VISSGGMHTGSAHGDQPSVYQSGSAPFVADQAVTGPLQMVDAARAPRIRKEERPPVAE